MTMTDDLTAAPPADLVQGCDAVFPQAEFAARLARLRPQVDAFFDGVMVNAEDAQLRANRLALLKKLGDRLGSVAAIEHLSS